MSTRSILARENADKSVDAIYCHSDGYPEHHGPILTEAYADPAKVDTLIALGNLSVLDVEIGEKHDFEVRPRDKKDEMSCLAYGRDRGETGSEAVHYIAWETLRADLKQYGAEYVYVFRAGAWMWTPVKRERRRMELMPLTSAAWLKKEEAEDVED